MYDALHEAFYSDRDVTNEDLLKAARVSVPLSMTMREKIAYMRDWAETRARKAEEANKKAPVTTGAFQNRLPDPLTASSDCRRPAAPSSN